MIKMENCCHYIRKIIKSCDFFGTYITLRKNNEVEYKSIIGGLSSILIIIISLLYIIYEIILF